MTKVSFITTVNHNVGDDLVREGVIYLLEKVIGRFQPQLIHKHIPLTVRPEWEWFYRSGVSGLLDKVPKLSGHRVSQVIDLLPLNERTDKILNCDLLIQSGAPVYWLHQWGSCANNEWWKPFIKKRWMRVKQRVPFLSIAGGTCQAYHSDGLEFSRSPRTLEYIREFYQICALTTVRDELSRKILNLIGIDDVPVLPCPSIFARKRLKIEPQTPSYVAWNYMDGGGHYKFNQEIDDVKWKRTFVRFATDLAKKEECILVCHNRKELQTARRLFPEFSIFYSKDYIDYLLFYSKAKYGIFNRVHGAFALASFGRPSIIIGSDTRTRMAEIIGLRNYFVNEVSEDMLWTEKSRLEEESNAFQQSISSFQYQSEVTYLAAIQKALQCDV